MKPASEQAYFQSESEPDARCVAAEVLTVSPPAVSEDDALSVARQAYGRDGSVQVLGGERDKNFLLRSPNAPDAVLKFINPAETAAETDLQIRALQWLEARHMALTVPRALNTQSGDDVHEFVGDGVRCMVRAYTFVPGLAMLKRPVNAALRRSFGKTAAQMVSAFEGFDHAALSRVLLLDVMHVCQLRSWAEEALTDDDEKAAVLAFLNHFECEVLPALRALPQQVIHGDISKSNTVIEREGADELFGVLDFGDLSKAPRVVELAVAASYAADDAEQPWQAVREVAEGYESVLALSDTEKRLLPDAVLARLVQRIVIAEWRALRFPKNRDYILRSTAAARELWHKLCADKDAYYE